MFHPKSFARQSFHPVAWAPLVWQTVWHAADVARDLRRVWAVAPAWPAWLSPDLARPWVASTALTNWVAQLTLRPPWVVADPRSFESNTP